MKVKPTNKRNRVLIELADRDDRLIEAAEASASPFRIKNILVPIDFSECSKKALRYAMAFAREQKATLTLVYVVAANYALGEASSIEFTRLIAEMRKSGEQQLSKLVKEEIGDRVPAKTVLRVGSAASEIAAAAKELNADLIIISTHGHSGLKHFFVGSVTEHVVRRAPCPVLVVREKETEFLAGESAAQAVS